MAPSEADPPEDAIEAGGGLGGQRALADPGLAAEQDDRALALAGPLGRLVQPGELVRPPDQQSPLTHLKSSLGAKPGALLQTSS